MLNPKTSGLGFRVFTGHGVRLYRGGYRYAFTRPLPIAHAITLRANPPQGHPNTTLLGFRVCPQTPGRLNFLFAFAHRADAIATKRSETSTPTVGRRFCRAQERREDWFKVCVWGGPPGPKSTFGAVDEESVQREAFERQFCATGAPSGLLKASLYYGQPAVGPTPGFAANRAVRH